MLRGDHGREVLMNGDVKREAKTCRFIAGFPVWGAFVAASLLPLGYLALCCGLQKGSRGGPYLGIDSSAYNSIMLLAPLHILGSKADNDR